VLKVLFMQLYIVSFGHSDISYYGIRASLLTCFVAATSYYLRRRQLTQADACMCRQAGDGAVPV